MSTGSRHTRTVSRPADLPGLLLLLAALCLALAFTGCGGADKVPYPFEDGDTFEYRGHSPQSGVVSHLRYVVEKDGSGFILRRYHSLESAVDRSGEAHLANVENICDRYGRVKKRASGKSAGSCKGNYCFLWLPPSKRQVGATVGLSEDARDATVVQEMRRDQRDVLKVTVGSRTFYYDRISGYLVEDENSCKLVRSSKGPI